MSYGDRTDFEAAALGIFNQGRRRIETHWLIIKQAHKEFGGTMHLQPGTGVGDQCEADRMRFWKSVERKRSNGSKNFFSHFILYAIGAEGGAQLGFDALHSLL